MICLCDSACRSGARCPAPHDFFGQPSARRRPMALCPRENRARRRGLGGSRGGRPQQASASSGARRLRGGSPRRKKSLRGHRGPQGGITREPQSSPWRDGGEKLSQWRDDFVAGGEARLKHREVAVPRARSTTSGSRASWRISPPTGRRCWPSRFHLDAGRPLAWWRSKRCHETSPSTHRSVRHRPRHARVAGAALDGLRATDRAPGRRRWPSADPSRRTSRMRSWKRPRSGP